VRLKCSFHFVFYLLFISVQGNVMAHYTTQLWTAKLRIIFEITKKYIEIRPNIYVFFVNSLGFCLIYSNFATFL